MGGSVSLHSFAVVVTAMAGYVLLYIIFRRRDARATLTSTLCSERFRNLPRGLSRDQASIVHDTDPCPSVSAVATAYVITPTYTRHTQEADLLRFCYALMHVPHIRWIVVEDSKNETELVSSLLQNCQGTNITYLATKSLPPGKKPGTNITLAPHRGVAQRNTGLAWLRKCVLPTSRAGGVYFADDDNTYDIRVFDVVRNATKVSMWKVGLVGGLLVEGPTCLNGTVTGWRVSWAPSRAFPIDMAGFAVGLDLLAKFPTSIFSPEAYSGFLESTFLKSLNISKTDIRPAPDPNCSKVLAWHTRTSRPKVNGEVKLARVAQAEQKKNITEN